MSVEIKGDKEIIEYIQKKYGTTARQRMEQAAIKKSGNVMVDKMAEAFGPHLKTGRTNIDLNLYGPNNRIGFNRAKINWDGEFERYRVMHLNEFGHFLRNGEFYTNPRRQGLIENTKRASRNEFRKAIKEELEKRV